MILPLMRLPAASEAERRQVDMEEILSKSPQARQLIGMMNEVIADAIEGNAGRNRRAVMEMGEQKHAARLEKVLLQVNVGELVKAVDLDAAEQPGTKRKKVR